MAGFRSRRLRRRQTVFMTTVWASFIFIMTMVIYLNTYSVNIVRVNPTLNKVQYSAYKRIQPSKNKWNRTSKLKNNTVKNNKNWRNYTKIYSNHTANATIKLNNATKKLNKTIKTVPYPVECETLFEMFPVHPIHVKQQQLNQTNNTKSYNMTYINDKSNQSRSNYSEKFRRTKFRRSVSFIRQIAGKISNVNYSLNRTNVTRPMNATNATYPINITNPKYVINNSHIRDFNYLDCAPFLESTTAPPFKYSIPYVVENPQICQGNVSVLIIVHTAVGHFDRRERLRTMFGNSSWLQLNYTSQLRIAFLLGESANATSATRLKEENAKFRDIVQAPYQDLFKNLTVRGVMALRWVALHCSHAKLILKIEDDMYVHIFKLAEVHHPEHLSKRRQILCNTIFPAPIMFRNMPCWANSAMQREARFYSPFCCGFTVLMSTDSVTVMYEVTQFKPFFWIDEVYLFGLLPSNSNITLGKFDKKLTLELDKCKAAYETTNNQTISCGARKTTDPKYSWTTSILTLTPALRGLVSNERITSITPDTTYLFLFG